MLIEAFSGFKATQQTSEEYVRSKTSSPPSPRVGDLYVLVNENQRAEVAVKYNETD